MKVCKFCNGEIAATKKANAIYCCDKCRKQAYEYRHPNRHKSKISSIKHEETKKIDLNELQASREALEEKAKINIFNFWRRT